MSLYRDLKNGVRLVRDGLACAIVSSAPRNECAVIRMDAIGDYFLWRSQGSLLCSHLQSRGFRTVLIANDIWSELASGELPFDEVFPVNRNRFRNSVPYRLHTIRTLRRRGFCEVYNPSFSRDLLIGDSLVRSCGAPVSVGFDGDSTIRSGTDRRRGDLWYTKLIPPSPGQLHESRRNQEFVMGVTGTEASPAGTRQRLPLSGERSYFVIAPGAAWKGRRWPAGNFIEIARRILAIRPGWRCVVAGSRDERDLTGMISGSLAGRGENLAGMTTLPELVEIVSSAQFVIANESAAGHIAAMHDTPSVVILGGGHFGRFMPYPDDAARDGALPPECIFSAMECFGCNWKCKYRVKSGAAVPCIEQIGIERVWKVVDSSFSRQ